MYMIFRGAECCSDVVITGSVVVLSVQRVYELPSKNGPTILGMSRHFQAHLALLLTGVMCLCEMVKPEAVRSHLKQGPGQLNHSKGDIMLLNMVQTGNVCTRT